MAHTLGPWRRAKFCANERGSALTTKLTSPCLYSSTSLWRCFATARKPMRSNSAPSALGSGAAYSTNSKPSVPTGFSQGLFMERSYACKMAANRRHRGRNLVRSVVLVCSVLLAAPALAQEERKECLTLSGIEAAKLRSIRVASAIPQAELVAEAVPVQHTHIQVPLVGFFPAVIASVAVTMAAQSAAESQAKGRLAAAQAMLAPLLETARDFDVRRQFWSRLQRALGDGARFRVLDIATLAEDPVVASRPAAGEAADAVLELRTQYALTPDLRSFGMTTRARLLAR